MLWSVFPEHAYNHLKLVHENDFSDNILICPSKFPQQCYSQEFSNSIYASKAFKIIFGSYIFMTEHLPDKI